ncbi:MAG: mannose-1-phosphate guanylyltransferase/mannose-6-phosphate isomerase [Campylobacteraceae bacterium]|jgi:mannose-1-phosphate guanylyltransferase|nr:mannose-1-phosphate guanylyltransferase/mannose-6-phosphate isomerase [Campylobacteraceae bacterium]
MINIILSGGSGTRLWPLSRKLMPKQFIKLFDSKSLFQLTVQRNASFCENPIIVSNVEQYFLAMDQLEELGIIKNSSCILEPVGRNTAAAIALASFALDEESIALVTPSDHLIKDEKNYKEALQKARDLAEKDFLVTFGIKPFCCETGFGYIEADGFRVKSFKEKPDIKTAEKYIKSGNYYWNSGMFCFKIKTFLKELKEYAPNIYDSSLKAFNNAKTDGKTGCFDKLIRIDMQDMARIDEISIDYALMEKSSNAAVVPSDIGWSDVGSFDALSIEMPENHDNANNLILADKEVNIIDVNDLIVVDTKDALLISKKGSSQKVKDIVAALQKSEKKDLTSLHVKANRPWGTYEVLEIGDGYKIKKIEVKPNKRLSLQKHFHRNEHWIVVSGTAKVTINDKSFLVRENESTYIKSGDIHRLENPGKIPLVLIEAQVGKYTGEDDIVRIEDDFKRIN